MLKAARELLIAERFMELAEHLLQLSQSSLSPEERIERSYLLGLCAAAAGDHAQAEGHYQNALSLCGNAFDPGELYYSLTVNLSIQGRLDEALQFALKAWDGRSKSNAENHGHIAWMIGVIYVQLKHDDAAEKWLRESIRHWGRWNTEAADAYYYLGMLAMVREDWTLSARYLTRARFLYPKGSSCHEDAGQKLALVNKHIKHTAGYAPYVIYGGGLLTSVVVLSSTRFGLAGGAGLAGLGASMVWALSHVGLV